MSGAPDPADYVLIGRCPASDDPNVVYLEPHKPAYYLPVRLWNRPPTAVHFGREVCLYHHTMWRSDVPVVSDYDYHVRVEGVRATVRSYESNKRSRRRAEFSSSR